jgi:hypothetical protein
MLRIGLPWITAFGLVLAGCGDKGATETSGAGTEPADTTGDAPVTSSGPTAATNPGSATESASDPTTTGASASGASNPDPTNTSNPDPSDPTNAESGGFIDRPDGGLAGQCDPKSQDCPAGEKCSAVSDAPGEPWGVNICVPMKGDSQVGDPCDIEDGKYTGVDNCDVGLICLLTDDEGKGGACVEFCDSSDTCPGTPTAKCVTYNDGSLPICLNDCDPLIQDCPAGQACYNSAGDNFVCFKESAMAGEGTPGDECAYINQCQKGTFCAAATALAECPTPSCCTPYCPVSGGNAPCNMGEDCVAFFAEGMAPPGLEDVGVCAIPG